MLIPLGGLLFGLLLSLHPAAAHEDYSGIKNKDGDSCCNKRDCHRAFEETDFIVKVEGGYVLKSTGEFIPEKLTAISPNQFWHICRNYRSARFGENGTNLILDERGKVRCLMIPGPGT